MTALTRRQALLTASASLFAGSSAWAQGDTPWRQERIVDCHHHLRADMASNVAHLDGAGMSQAMPLIQDDKGRDLFLALQARYPGRFVGWKRGVNSMDPNGMETLTKAVRDGALGFGEIKSKVAADSAENQRMFALAGELNVPIMLHFEDTPITGTDGFNTGYKRFEAMLKRYPKTRFILHATSVWANIDAADTGATANPRGKVTPVGLTDRLLADYANAYIDLAAYSGFNGLSRDPEFTPPFLVRHQDKLIYGSDCTCADGHGGGVTGPGAGQCLARQTLALIYRVAPIAVFRKAAWENAARLHGFKA